MKKYILPLILCACLLLGCSPKGGEDGPNGKTSTEPTKGNRYYGGVFNLNESEYIKNLFPLSIIDVYSYRVATQIYEGLLKFDQRDLSIIPSLAESYEVDETNTVYTFKLKQGVFFHDDISFPNNKGREFKATDVEYCFRRLCTQSRENSSFSLFDGIVKGARAYYDATKKNETPNMELEGVKVVDDYTIQITLEKPNSIFLYNLCRPGTFIYPREAFEYHQIDMREKCVGTGPFTLASLDEDISIILRRNPNYHRKDEFGNQLPFLEAINIQFLRDKKVELLEFKKGNLDMMYRLPTEYIIEILEGATQESNGGYSQYDLQRTPEMSTQIIALYNQGEIFKDINVRKAFNFAVNRERILNNVLNGEGYEYGKYGITPPSFKNYDVATKIKGYEFNVDSARYYLKKAGYKNGKGFPVLKLDLNAEGERYTNVAVDIKKQLKDNLNIDIELNIAPLAKITEKSTTGSYDFLRLAWIGDYPSPENFLWFFYGKGVPKEEGAASYPNLTRYQNPEFDRLYELGLNATSEDEALNYFMQAEQIAMNDAPIIVLWYDEGYRLMQSYVKNFPNNPLQYRDFSEVYLDFGNRNEEEGK